MKLRVPPTLVVSVLTLVLAPWQARAQELAELVTLRTLDNGLRVIMVQQDFAPVIAFNLMFDVGAIDEADGLGGIAHMVEHMAFKGTRTIGSLDPDTEAAMLSELETLAVALAEAETNGLDADEIAALRQAFSAKRQEAQALALPNALDLLFDANGAVGLNASTGYDRTSYVIQLPANRLELYARVYADIMLEPTFRFFYEERDVVREERRQTSEDDPAGFLAEAFREAAFAEHPYGRSLIGTAAEIEGYLADDAMDFFETFYHPHRAVLVMVGDVEPERDMAIIERYFGTIPRGPDVRPDITAEPTQQQERRFTVRYDAEPRLLVGYHKPTYPERDAYVMDVISTILTSGRTSRLYRRMVLEDEVAVNVSTSSAYPGLRDANAFLLSGLPRFPNTTEDMETVLYEELARLGEELVSERELEKVRNQVRAGFLGVLTSGSGLAAQLATYELFLGGWENLLAYEEAVTSVTAEEILEVAARYFTPENRTVGTLLPLEEAQP